MKLKIMGAEVFDSSMVMNDTIYIGVEKMNFYIEIPLNNVVRGNILMVYPNSVTLYPNSVTLYPYSVTLYPYSVALYPYNVTLYPYNVALYPYNVALYLFSGKISKIKSNLIRKSSLIKQLKDE